MYTLPKYRRALLLTNATAQKTSLHLFCLFVAVLLCITASAWLESGNHVKQQLDAAIDLSRDNAMHDSDDIALGLQRNLLLLHGIPNAIGKSQQLVDALRTRTPQAPERTALNQFLENAARELGVISTLWVIDVQCNCVAASNANSADSFIGTNYADRDYFKTAMSGQAGRQFAIGKRTHIPGLYFSAPVFLQDKVVGVVTAKVDLPYLTLWLSQADAFVTDEYGVVILATQAQTLLHRVANAGTQPLNEAQSLQRYLLKQVPELVMRQSKRAGFTDMVFRDDNATPAIHIQHAIGGDNRLLVHVMGPVPYALTMDTERVTRFALETGFGVLMLLLVGTAAFYVLHIKRAQVALELHKSRLNEAQLLAQVGSWELSLASGAMKWSPQVHRIFQSDPSAVDANLAAFLERIQEADRPTLRKMLEDVSGSQERVECLVGIVRMDGEAGRARLQLQPAFDKDGGVDGFLGTLRDTTAQEMLENQLRRAKAEAESASQLKSDFLANISHEFNTPMNAILGMSYLALQGELSPAQRNHIQTVHRSAEQLLSLITEILEFSKIEAGKFTMHRREFALHELTRKLADRMASLAEDKGLAFQLNLPPAMPARLLGDPDQLSRVLNAIAANAIKFTQQGNIQVGVEVTSQSGSRIDLHFWVADTGVGISPEQQKSLFQAFSQADNSTTRKFGGAGLGLTLAQRIIDMMGGRIWVLSRQGVGTTVHFSAPFEVLEDAPAAPAQPGILATLAAPLLLENQAGMHVLLVEDNPVNQELARMVLKKFGIAVTIAVNGQEALDILQTRTDFQAILMDCHMPLMDGYTATQEIRKIESLNAIPVIAITANVSSEDRKKMAESGMCDVVAKPYKAQDLVDALQRWTTPVHPFAPPSAHGLSSHASAIQFPDLPGIDVAYGLGIAMQDAELYKKLLVMYSQSEANFVGQFHTAMQAGDRLTCERLAHSLKGISASIGAKDVQAAALALQLAYQDEPAEADLLPLLKQTALALQRVMGGLASLQQSSQSRDAVPFDRVRVRALAEQLQQLLAKHDLSAYDVAEQLSAAASGSPIASLVAQVIKAIDRFDLETAQTELNLAFATLEGS